MQRKTKKMLNDIISKLLILTCTILIFLILVELLLRLHISIPNKMYLLENYSDSDVRNRVINFYFPPFGLQEHYKYYIKLNSDGLRDREFSINKPRDTIRIAVIGDSFTFGVGVNDTSRIYPKQLEYMLNNNSKKISFEVINFGMGALNALDIYYVLKKKVLKYNPDIIMYGYFANDPNFREDEIHVPIKFCFEKQPFYFYYFINKRIQNLLNKVNSPEKQYYSHIKYIHTEKSVEWICLKNIIKKIDQQIIDDNNTFIMFNIPSEIHEEDRSATKLIENRLSNEVATTNIVFLNISSAIYEITGSLNHTNYLVDFPVDNHYNEIGHNIIAQVLHTKLKESLKII